MTQKLYFLIAILCALAGTASAESVTYTISGSTETNYPHPGDLTCNLNVTALGNETGTRSACPSR